jgi:RNase H-fold protein (predicted Holliday junction resolvase)
MAGAPYLALDLGRRRTGMAISEDGAIVVALPTLSWEPAGRAQHIAALISLVNKRGVRTVVAGLPHDATGPMSTQAEWTEGLHRDIIAALPPGIEFTSMDESHTTHDGKAAFTDLDRDAAAAALLLETYLESFSAPHA